MLIACRFCLKDRQDYLFYETKIGGMCNYCNASFVKQKIYVPETHSWNGISLNTRYIPKKRHNRKKRVNITILTKEVRDRLRPKYNEWIVYEEAYNDYD